MNISLWFTLKLRINSKNNINQNSKETDYPMGK